MPKNRFLNEKARKARLSPDYEPKRCDHCQQVFAPYRLKNARFCSMLCRRRAAYKAANPRIEKACARCGAPFTPKASNKAIYCSTRCNKAVTTAKAKLDPARLERRRRRARIYSKTEKFRFTQINHKARRRSVENEGRVTEAEWKAIIARFNDSCAYCRADDLKLTMDHVIPLSKGGRHCADNVVPACQPCNSAKCDSIWAVPQCQ